jgi:hypothetical protein
MAAVTLTDAGLARIESLAGSPAAVTSEGVSKIRRSVSARVIEDRPGGEIIAEPACLESVVRLPVSPGEWAAGTRAVGGSGPTDDPVATLKRGLLRVVRCAVADRRVDATPVVGAVGPSQVSVITVRPYLPITRIERAF